MQILTNKAVKNLFIWRLLIIPLLFQALSVNAEETSREYRIKAAFIYNFTKFIEWPEQDISSLESFDICMVGDERLSVAAAVLQGKPVNETKLGIRHIDSISEHQDCKIIFFAISNKKRLEQSLFAIEGMGILSIGDNSNFIDYGGVISLYGKNNQIKFDINQIVADRNGLKISAQLLELANRVIRPVLPEQKMQIK